jgi:hypothetical protein
MMPSSPINEACGTWASTQAAYRLFNNPKASTAGILKPHREATAQRMAGCGGPVLVMQDTVFFSYGTHVKTRGLGPIGKSNAAHDRGLIMHNALAFTTSGVPLGILSQSIWARGEIPEEDYQEKIERLQVTAIEEKESSKWLIALHETVERAPAGVPVITVADRESDFFEFLTQAKELRAKYLIRACTNRKLVPEDSEGCASMLEALSIAPALGSITVAVPSNGRRKARTASIEVRVTEVTIQAPRRRAAHAKASGSSEPVTVTLVGATEQSPPAGSEAISWVLLTNLGIKDFESAAEKVRWYGKRWGIEIWHKVLKSGCKVEDCMLEEAERLKRYLTLFSIIGVRLMHVAFLARAQPDSAGHRSLLGGGNPSAASARDQGTAAGHPIPHPARGRAHARQTRRPPRAQGRRRARRAHPVARLDALVRIGGNAALAANGRPGRGELKNEATADATLTPAEIDLIRELLKTPQINRARLSREVCASG